MSRKPARSPEDQSIIEKGKLWQSFLDTQYYLDMKVFVEKEVSDLKDLVVEHTIAGRYEEAKMAGHQISGIYRVWNYMTDNVNFMRETIETEKEQRQYQERIPSHVS